MNRSWLLNEGIVVKETNARLQDFFLFSVFKIPISCRAPLWFEIIRSYVNGNASYFVLKLCFGGFIGLNSQNVY